MPQLTCLTFNSHHPNIRTDNVMLTWLHIGDLHLTDAHEQNHCDLGRIIEAISELSPDDVDFVFLPGDNADDGTHVQFQLVSDAIGRLRLPIHVLPGDHDYKPKSLDAFYEILGARRLPYADTIKGHRCLFLDVVSAGTGGPDFRLTDDHLDWIERETSAAAAAGQEVVDFMHTYPADLTAGRSRLNELLTAEHVLCVDMGNTHYNELANDGHTIFMATRSTGQIEEGPVGFSVAAVDQGGVSWRFKPLEEGWPLTLITKPTDRRLVTGGKGGIAGLAVVRAKVLSNALVEAVEFSADGAVWQPMRLREDDGTVWDAPLDESCSVLTVRARDTQGRYDQDVVEPPDPDWRPSARAAVKRHTTGALTQSRCRRGKFGEHDTGALPCDEFQFRRNRLPVF
jgi:Icc protein